MTRFSVLESVRHLIGQYRSFIKSSYRLADSKLREQFERHVNEAEVLAKGPHVMLSRDFAQGNTLAQVLASGCGHPDLARLNWPFGEASLFAHQETTLRAIETSRNIIVKTGTGSGLTKKGVYFSYTLCLRDSTFRFLHPNEVAARDFGTSEASSV